MTDKQNVILLTIATLAVALIVNVAAYYHDRKTEDPAGVQTSVRAVAAHATVRRRRNASWLEEIYIATPPRETTRTVRAAGAQCEVLYVWLEDSSARDAAALHEHVLTTPDWWRQYGFRGVLYYDSYTRATVYTAGRITAIEKRWPTTLATCPPLL